MIISKLLPHLAIFLGNMILFTGMTRPVLLAIYIAALIGVVICVDVLFFRGRFFERLIANIGIVLIFGAFYLRFLK